MPRANEATLRLTSRTASSISSRASALACSATCLAEAPSPASCSVARVGMAPPVEHLGGHAAFDEEIRAGHRFVGGCSPVATVQIFDAARRAAIVAPAASPL